ncbi:sensor histidine kinase [Lacimicrobium alkaliphilum]|uniref:ATPase n=1 Tax=Lacimicrobium alkaliphilum TaxID=1526571 RepID=A0ABQ1QVC8_9ALTE|nr:histidine kinase [Lacimicrobium alkaliphilum]GGD48176.1 ATPase [Lacimicrobium alkaliphilum]
MLGSRFKHMSGWRFWLGNILFWLLMNTYAADLGYRSMARAGQEVEWLVVWLYYFGWWMPWAIVTPLVLAATRVVPLNWQKWRRTLWQLILMAIGAFVIYLALAVPMIAGIEMKSLAPEKVLEAWNLIFERSAWHFDLLTYIAVVSIGYITQYYDKARKEEARSESLLRQLVQLELQSLKSQLNPHFLFNTLNTVASLIRLDEKDKAVKALSELSLMLRKVLENQSNQLISLTQEMEFIQSYLTIQQMRFENKLETKVEVNPECLKMDVPFMLLQPLVENAVQHGSQLESDKNQLLLRVWCQPGELHVKLTNKVPQNDDHHGFGIGLKNCRERLKKLYDDNYQLRLTELENGYFETYLILPGGGEDD